MAKLMEKLEYALFLKEMLEQLDDEELARCVGLKIGYDEGSVAPSKGCFPHPIKD